MGETGIWWSVPIGWVSGLILSILYYKTGRWKTKAIVKPVPANPALAAPDIEIE